MFKLMDAIQSYEEAFSVEEPESELAVLRDDILNQTGIDSDMKDVVDGILQDDTMTTEDKFMLIDEL